MKFFFDMRNTLYWIFCIFGVDFKSNSSRIKRNVTLLCRIFTFIVVLPLLFVHTISPRNFKKDSPTDIKLFISALIVFSCSIVLLYALHVSKLKISKILRDITELKNSVFTNKIDIFSTIFILYTVSSYLVILFFRLYSLNDEKCTQLMEKLFLEKLHNRNIKLFLTIVFIVGSESIIILLPHAFIALYIVTCHEIKIVLDSTKATSTCYGKTLKFLDNYSFLLSKFEKFNSVCSMPIFIAFTNRITVLFLSILLVSSNMTKYAFIYNIIFISIVLATLFFVASNVMKADKSVKKINLDKLQRLLIIGKDVHKSTEMIIWQLNNAPPLILTAWDFFAFSKNSFLVCVSSLVTYILLLMNL